MAFSFAGAPPNIAGSYCERLETAVPRFQLLICTAAKISQPISSSLKCPFKFVESLARRAAVGDQGHFLGPAERRALLVRVQWRFLPSGQARSCARQVPAGGEAPGRCASEGRKRSR